MLKRLLKTLPIITLLLLIFTAPIKAEFSTNLYFFYSKTCPHCAKEKPFLESLVQKYPDLSLYSLEISNSLQNAYFMQQVGYTLKTDTSGVPFTVIGGQHLTGWRDDQATKEALEKQVVECLEYSCPDPITDIIPANIKPITVQPTQTNSPLPKPVEEDKKIPSQLTVIPETLNLPIVGQIKTKEVSLPFLTIIIGLLDGFNPCAMWVLVFLISLLINMKDKKRRWILGMVFIAASGFVYFLFLSAWLNLFLFLGLLLWVRILIGLLSLFIGGKNLKSFYEHHAGCPIGNSQKRQRIFKRLQSIIDKKQLLTALIGIILLAFAVNLVELICSAGLPAVYTQILTLSDLPSWQYYAYLLLYIIFFMIDDLIIFVLAMKTLEVTNVESKYTHISHLIGGLLMLFIGLAMLLKPELLTIG